ncbi:MAG: PTS sugar transporter subunit IIA [Gemmataceae bacterium]|nr:PTS sugar transporter subunit IIA [Gemmataceae bacterium]
MDLEQLATYLQRDARELSKLASRGQLPAQKVGGEWRFASAEIAYWIETQMPGYTEEELTKLEDSGEDGDGELVLTPLLSENTTAVPLRAGTRASALRELVRLAGQSWQLFDTEALLAAVKLREEQGSTGLANGVAIPHPRRPLPALLGDHVLAYGRTHAGIPYGAADGGLSDIFFLVCCRDQRTHLNVLARLSRLMLRPNFLDDLRGADTVQKTLQLIESAEKSLGHG